VDEEDYLRLRPGKFEWLWLLAVVLDVKPPLRE